MNQQIAVQLLRNKYINTCIYCLLLTIYNILDSFHTHIRKVCKTYMSNVKSKFYDNHVY